MAEPVDTRICWGKAVLLRGFACAAVLGIVLNGLKK
jgi:hypothetical protein